jgi:zinc transporter ZupT
MLINSDFEIAYLIVIFALLGIVLFGALLSALHLDRWHPKVVSAVVGAMIGVALIEAIPAIT